LFDTFESIFEQKPPQSEILDIQGLRPRYEQYSSSRSTQRTACFLSRVDFNIGGTAVSVMARHRKRLVNTRAVRTHRSTVDVLCLGLDWSRHDSRLSGIASRLSDGSHGLFHRQYTWPCSIGDSNMGIFCIETNCDKRNYYKH
jgi:hypothetical protein